MRRILMAIGLATLVLALIAPPAGSMPMRRGPGSHARAVAFLDTRAWAQARTGHALSAPEVVTDNFEVVGHTDLGGHDTNADVWVHGDFAYVGTWGDPCDGVGVKIVDVSDPTHPKLIGHVGARKFTSAEDVVVRSVDSASFSGDLLAVGIQRCGGGKELDHAKFGAQFWDVTDPYDPERLGKIGSSTGFGGVHELDLFQRGSNIYALFATPDTEYFDDAHEGDFRIVDVTDPRKPKQIAEWGALENGMAEGPWDGLGALGTVFGHSVRASADGTKVYVSYWDLGVLTFDITDPADPQLISQTELAADSDGDTHSVSEYMGSRHFLLQNQEDADSRSPAHIVYGEPASTGIANESPLAPALFDQPDHQIEAPVVRAKGQGCKPSDYPSSTEGAIAVMRTVFMAYDEEKTEKRVCKQALQEENAEAAGAVAVVHDFISSATSPQWWTPGEVGVPVLFTDHVTAMGMVDAGTASLEALAPSTGYLQIYDAATGEQVAKFDDVANVHTLPPPKKSGVYSWTIHNNEVMGDTAFASWYTNGIVAIDLSPLNGVTPADPVRVGQFIPTGSRSHTSLIPDNLPSVWGVAIRASDGLIFVSDMTSGLWIVRPIGAASP